jgi:hypothetical protein
MAFMNRTDHTAANAREQPDQAAPVTASDQSAGNGNATFSDEENAGIDPTEVYGSLTNEARAEIDRAARTAA